ncbi:MAG: phosphoribosylglycinamide formyltransferase [Ignavibacteriae bacterium]|nr:MAG: phosphoribosylglycinamide formyltransferase [Ignavibacteriota bacterium]
MFKIIVFVSGRGSNFKAIYSQIEAGIIKAEILGVVSNNKSCKAIDFAKEKKIKTYLLGDKSQGNEFWDFDQLAKIFQKENIDLIVLAGFLKKISEAFVNKFKQKIINIHPALLPSFGGKGMYGSHVHKAVFEAACKVSGATIHFVDEVYDNGIIIAQEAVDISDVASPEEIAEKVLKIEHNLLPKVVKKFVENKIIIIKNRVIVI